MKKLITGFILGIIACSGIVYAANYLASDISYEPTDASWEVNNVNDALNDLYENSKSNNEPVTNSPILIYTGSRSGSVNVKNLYPDDYMNFTVDNFLYKPKEVYGYASSAYPLGTYQPTGKASYSYDANTGVLSYNTGYADTGVVNNAQVIAYLSSVEVYLIP